MGSGSTTVISGQQTDFSRWPGGEQPSSKGTPGICLALVPPEDQYNIHQNAVQPNPASPPCAGHTGEELAGNLE